MKKLKASKKSQTASSSAFQFTLNEVEFFDELREYVFSIKSFQYGIACKEFAPTTGHPHIHMYVQFKRSIRLSINKLCGAHIEKCMGSPQQNVLYIKKDGDIIWEEGEMKKKGGKTIKEVELMDKDKREELPLVYYNIVSKINAEESKFIKGTDYYKEIKVWYIWGESGVGKTRYAISKIGDRIFNEVKYIDGFWHGVTDKCDIALYDDWRDNHMKASEFINFIDYNRHVMNIKGGSIRNNYKEIYITTVQSPEDIYKSIYGEPRKQWERRMNVVNIGEFLGDLGELKIGDN